MVGSLQNVALLSLPYIHLIRPQGTYLTVGLDLGREGCKAEH